MDTSTAGPPERLLREEDIPGKSRGLVAISDISAGDVLILAQPDCVIIGNTDACEHCGQWTWRSSDALRRALDGCEDLIAQALFEAGITDPHPCAGAQCDRCSRRWCSTRCRLAGAASHALPFCVRLAKTFAHCGRLLGTFVSLPWPSPKPFQALSRPPMRTGTGRKRTQRAAFWSASARRHQ
jgi:hypothetical protein